MDNSEKDWKLKLRYGKVKTPYKHYTVIAKGIAGELADGFTCVPGNAYMGMKVWASSEAESADMIQSVGSQIGENPYGYDINFTPFQEG